MESPLRERGRDPGLKLIETLASSAPDARIARHLARMERGAGFLGWVFDPQTARDALQPHRGDGIRLRLTLDGQGTFAVETAPLPPPPPTAGWRVSIAARRLDSADPWLCIKSTRRASYDAERAALPPGTDEAIFLNERGEVCDGTITTLFFDRGQGLRTPPLACGLLPGILREETLEQGVREEVLLAEDFPHVRLWVGNSMRGMIPARLVP